MIIIYMWLSRCLLFSLHCHCFTIKLWTSKLPDLIHISSSACMTDSSQFMYLSALFSFSKTSLPSSGYSLSPSPSPSDPFQVFTNFHYSCTVFSLVLTINQTVLTCWKSLGICLFPCTRDTQPLNQPQLKAHGTLLELAVDLIPLMKLSFVWLCRGPVWMFKFLQRSSLLLFCERLEFDASASNFALFGLNLH